MTSSIKFSVRLHSTYFIFDHDDTSFEQICSSEHEAKSIIRWCGYDQQTRYIAVQDRVVIEKTPSPVFSVSDGDLAHRILDTADAVRSSGSSILDVGGRQYFLNVVSGHFQVLYALDSDGYEVWYAVLITERHRHDPPGIFTIRVHLDRHELNVREHLFMRSIL